jgi:hypothetical protein
MKRVATAQYCYCVRKCKYQQLETVRVCRIVIYLSECTEFIRRKHKVQFSSRTNNIRANGRAEFNYQTAVGPLQSADSILTAEVTQFMAKHHKWCMCIEWRLFTSYKPSSLHP